MSTLIDFIDVANVGMIERRSRAGFTFEPLDGCRVSTVFRQELECDLTAQVNVLCPVDDSHTSLT